MGLVPFCRPFVIYDRKMKTAQIIGGIRTILEDLLEGSLKKAEKLTLIDKRVLKNQDVRDMDSENLCAILDFIKDKIFPFINDKSTAGQDLLNLFFITFNKYVGKSDKNQAFTPDHITDFMAKICNVNKSSVVLDMACGSGSFLVRAMTQALADCHTQAEEDEVKKHHIYGVEYDELVYGLATTNMLIHMRMLMTQIDSLDPADRSYERKFNDLQRRLDDLYDRDAGLSDALEEAHAKMTTAEKRMDGERRLLEELDRIPEQLEGADEQTRFDLIHEAVSEVHIRPDKNPRKERVVANVTFKCPVRFFWEGIPGVADAYTPMTPDSLRENNFRDDEAHVETVALLTGPATKPGKRMEKRQERRLAP